MFSGATDFVKSTWNSLTKSPIQKGSGSTISPAQEKILNQYLSSYGPNSDYGQALMGLRTDMMGYNPVYEYDPTAVNTRFTQYYRPEFERSMALAQDELDQGFTGNNRNYWSTGRARAKTELGSNLASQYNRQLASMHDTAQARGIAAAEAARGRQMTMAQLDPAQGLSATSTQQPYAIQGESMLTQGMNMMSMGTNMMGSLLPLAML